MKKRLASLLRHVANRLDAPPIATEAMFTPWAINSLAQNGSQFVTWQYPPPPGTRNDR
jgi:hypothetical protein